MIVPENKKEQLNTAIKKALSAKTTKEIGAAMEEILPIVCYDPDVEYFNDMIAMYKEFENIAKEKDAMIPFVFGCWFGQYFAHVREILGKDFESFKE